MACFSFIPAWLPCVCQLLPGPAEPDADPLPGAASALRPAAGCPGPGHGNWGRRRFCSNRCCCERADFCVFGGALRTFFYPQTLTSVFCGPSGEEAAACRGSAWPAVRRITGVWGEPGAHLPRFLLGGCCRAGRWASASAGGAARRPRDYISRRAARGRAPGGRKPRRGGKGGPRLHPPPCARGSR